MKVRRRRRTVEDEDGGEGFLPWLLALVAWMVLVEAVDEAAAGWMEGWERKTKMRMTVVTVKLLLGPTLQRSKTS